MLKKNYNSYQKEIIDAKKTRFVLSKKKYIDANK